ncbi:vitamin K epoxide reductase family protein [Dinghuibacter silviterrae]|uniref:Putative membrane protein n=1 Tax=Dinghuibacter silviterrae TaxID=1539049 RepID=A0A4R8DP09_9BACT|nr:vitamin K epoxide reductase family protein [Dinghuibacter silviterrae]TDW99154.1 putative membrane protein [Dinghuibacter silviterrae]
MAQSFNTKLSAVAASYARLLGLKITETSLKRDLEENPYYPSLLGLSDTFDRYGIPNAAYRVEDLAMAPAPFVAYAQTEGNVRDFVLVTRQDGASVSVVYDKGGKAVSLSKEDFLKKFQKVVWMAEPGDYPGEPDFAEKRARERNLQVKKGVAIAAAVVGLLALVWMNGVSRTDALPYGFLLLTKLFGVAVSVLLLLYEMGSGGDFVKNICQGGGQRDCGAVLESKGASVAGLTWSEVGFFYFAATLSGLLFPGIPFQEKTSWLCWGSFLAVLYVPFSIYYQWRVAKQWCPLCLSVQSVLVLEAVWAFLEYQAPVNVIAAVPAVLFCAVWPVVGWFFLKPLWRKAKDSDQYRSSFRRLRANPDLFQGLLQQQPQAPEGLEHLGIVLGNPDASIRITKVCNPYCGPCAKAHPLLEQVLERNRNVQLRMVFSAKNDANDKKTPVVKHFLALARRGEPGLIQKALDDWYLSPQKDYDKFAEKYPLSEGEGKEEAAIEAMSQWCEKAEIAFTPTLFVNGHRLPEEYGAQELTEIF